MFKGMFSKEWAIKAAKGEELLDAKNQAIAVIEAGSEFKVPYTTILAIDKHPNADRLEIATVYGFQVVVQKGKYFVGDPIIYVPIDSLIPQWLHDIVFPIGSKITLNKRRVRQINIRKIASQGMIVDREDVFSRVNINYLTLEQDLSLILGVKKYEPPQRGNAFSPPNPRNKIKENARFHEYGGVDNIKWFPNLFEGQEVIIQEKLHGSCCRASKSKMVADTFWKKVKKFLGVLPTYENCYGSNRVQIQNRGNYKGFYGDDVYGNVLKKVDAFYKIKDGETIYGELIGPGVQKGYEYGHYEHWFVLFDVKIEKEDGSQEYLDPEAVEAYAKERGFTFVPVLYRGIYNTALAKQLSMGPSVYAPSEKVREGIVIKKRTGYSEYSHKHALKLLSEEYLADDKNTDFH